MIESANGHGLRTIVSTHRRGNLELGTRTVIIERMQTSQSCRNRAYIIYFISLLINCRHYINATNTQPLCMQTICSYSLVYSQISNSCTAIRMYLKMTTSSSDVTFNFNILRANGPLRLDAIRKIATAPFYGTFSMKIRGACTPI